MSRRRWHWDDDGALSEFVVDVVLIVDVGYRRDAGGWLRSLKTIEDLREECRSGAFAPLRRNLALFVLVLGITHDAACLLDVVVDHRDDGVIGDTALARTIVVQHVAGPKPALLHAIPRKLVRSLCGRENRALVECRAPKGARTSRSVQCSSGRSGEQQKPAELSKWRLRTEVSTPDRGHH
jgi:hypothetical protein